MAVSVKGEIMGRTFEDKPAVRESVPLLIGLMGPSGGGKTYSALRLATGIQRVTGGDVYHIDTEARRALHYADKFKFRHLEFGAPFGSLDYLAAIEHCVSKGAKTIIVDSMSHEHEGPGGLLEQHAAETTRLAARWKCSENAAQMSAWGPCKADRRTMINRILQLRCNFVFCFRAKEKLKIVKGQEPKPMGYMAIAGEEFVYEMTMCALLMPGANGVPTWQSQEAGEAAMIKIPAQFRDLLLGAKGALSEDIGQELATWAAGEAAPPVASVAELRAAFETAQDTEAYKAANAAVKTAWSKLGKGDRDVLKALAESTAARLKKATEEPPPDSPPMREPGSDG